MLPPVIDVFGRSHHEYSVLNSRLNDTPVGNPATLLGSLLQQSVHPRKSFPLGNMLGELCYAARDPGTDRPARNLHPGRLAAISAHGEGHVRLDLPCRNPEGHEHEQLCTQWVDLELIRSGGTLEEGLSGAVIFKSDEDNAHRAINFLGISSRGLTFVQSPPGIPGQQFYQWLFPPEPIQRPDSGEMVFRDRRTDSTDLALFLDPARRRTGAFWALTKNPHDQDDQHLRSRPSLRGVLQGFALEQDWRYQDLNGRWIEAPAVRHSARNQDADLINGWLAAREADCKPSD